MKICLPRRAALIIMKWQEVVGYGSICCCGLVRLSEDCLQVWEEMPWIRCVLQPRPRAAWIQSSRQMAAHVWRLVSDWLPGTVPSHLKIYNKFWFWDQQVKQCNNSFYFSVEIESLMTLTFLFFQSVAKWHGEDCGISGDMSEISTTLWFSNTNWFQ